MPREEGVVTQPCEYCGRRMPVGELEGREATEYTPYRLVCKDRKACEQVEEKGYWERIKQLRKARRKGEELSEAEKQELEEAT